MYESAAERKTETIVEQLSAGVWRVLGKENLLSIKSTKNGWREFTPQEIHDKSSTTVLYGWTSPNTNIYPPTGSISNDKVDGESFMWLYTSFALDGDVTNLGFG